MAINQEARSIHTRREFCVGCSKAVGLLAIGGVSACSGSSTGPSSNTQSLATVPSTVSGRTVTVPLGSGSALASTGALATTQTSLGAFLLARTNADTLTVLTATCTHEGCGITQTNGSQFVCPCHGSTFSASGGVVKGPASRSLQQFAAVISGEVATFTA